MVRLPLLIHKVLRALLVEWILPAFLVQFILLELCIQKKIEFLLLPKLIAILVISTVLLNSVLKLVALVVPVLMDLFIAGIAGIDIARTDGAISLMVLMVPGSDDPSTVIYII